MPASGAPGSEAVPGARFERVERDRFAEAESYEAVARDAMGMRRGVERIVPLVRNCRGDIP